MQKPVAITGATGFVGGHVVDALLAAGHHLRVLVRDRAKYQRESEKLEVVEGNLEDLAALTKLTTGAGAVIHIAGSIAALNRAGFFKVNQAGAGNVAQAAADAGVKRFILVSSLAAREPDLSSYGASKLAGEQRVADLIGPQHLVIVRPPAVYGPGDKATLPLIKALTQKRAILPGRSDQKISLLYVKDLARLLAHLAKAGDLSGEVLEVDDGRAGGYSFADIAQCAGQALGRPVKLTLLPRGLVAMAGIGAKLASTVLRRAYVLSPEKVHELYHPDWVARGDQISGWQPQVQFEKGFGLALAWYRENQWLRGA